MGEKTVTIRLCTEYGGEKYEEFFKNVSVSSTWEEFLALADIGYYKSSIRITTTKNAPLLGNHIEETAKLFQRKFFLVKVKIPRVNVDFCCAKHSKAATQV